MSPHRIASVRERQIGSALGCSPAGLDVLIQACRIGTVVKDRRRDIRPDYLDADGRPTQAGRKAVETALSVGYSPYPRDAATPSRRTSR